MILNEATHEILKRTVRFTRKEETKLVDELVELVSKKAGLPEEMARVAVETVIGYLKGRLPGPVASQIDGVLGGAGGVEDLGGVAKGLFGKK
jgi:hypothetical protein